jgi:integrase
MARISKQVVDEAIAGSKTRFLWDESLPGFGLRVTKAGAKAYVVQYKIGKRTRRMTVAKVGKLTPAEAREAAKSLLADATKGGDPAAQKQTARVAPTIAELADRYLAEHADVHKKPRSAEEDRRNLKLHVLPSLGKRLVAEIGRQDVLRLHHSLRGMPAGANRVLALLSKMFNLAEAWGLRPDNSNPTRHVKKYAETKRERFLSAGELARLGEVLAEADLNGVEPAAGLDAIRLLLLTGCRRDEILTLKWDEGVDLQEGVLRLADTKTGKRVVRLGAPAVALLRSIKRADPNLYVFAGRRPGSRFVGIEKLWQRLRIRADIEDVRLHDLRHTYASWAVMDGHSLPVTGALLGHRHPGTTSRYAHLGADPLKAAADQISAGLDAALSAKNRKD